MLITLNELAVTLACPRCATGIAARRSVLEQAPLEHRLVALVPFVVVLVASIAIGRLGGGGGDPESTEFFTR